MLSQKDPLVAKKTRYTKAVAISYNAETDSAPLVSAKGRHLRADEIVKLARRYGVPVVEQPDLASELDQVDDNSSIPENLFEAVALLLHQLENTLSKGSTSI